MGCGMRFLSLFSGIGGFELGLERAGMTCVGQVEYNTFCQRVLKHHWPHVKLIGDIHDVKSTDFGPVELICGGFPCQPFSVAGKQRGKKDDRYLWPEMLRVIKTYLPTWVLGENVAGIIKMELDNVLTDLENAGYSCRAFVIPACSVDARHERKRVWIVGHSKHNGRNATKDTGGLIQRDERPEGTRRAEQAGEFTGSNILANTTNAGAKNLCGWKISAVKNVSDTHGAGCGEQRWSESIHPEQCTPQCSGEDGGAIWSPEPSVGRVANGVPGRVDRLRSLGNAVVPQVVEEIGRAIMMAEEWGNV